MFFDLYALKQLLPFEGRLEWCFWINYFF